MQVAWHGPSMTGDVPATFAADVLSFILSQPNSRFHRNLIDSGLFDFATVSYFSQVHTGPINAFGQTSPERLDKAHAALLNEVRHFADAGYFTDEELKFAKDQLEVSEIYNRERPTDFVHTVSFWWATGGLDYYRNYLDNLRKVTRADIQSYVRRYIAGKPSVTGVLVSDGNRGKIALLKNAEVVRPVSGSSATEMKADGGAAPTEELEVDGLRVILRRNPSTEVVSAKAFLQGRSRLRRTAARGTGAADAGDRGEAEREISERENGARADAPRRAAHHASSIISPTVNRSRSCVTRCRR